MSYGQIQSIERMEGFVLNRMIDSRSLVLGFPLGGSIPQEEKTGQKTDHLGTVRDEADNPYRRDLPKEQEQNDHGHTDGYRPVLEGDPGYAVDTMPIEDHEVAKLNGDPLALRHALTRLIEQRRVRGFGGGVRSRAERGQPRETGHGPGTRSCERAFRSPNATPYPVGDDLLRYGPPSASS
jgi:hypothetical protein